MRYTVEATIARPVEEVFAFCSDLRNELRWNPSAIEIAKLTEGNLRVGTRFRASWRNAPTTLVEVVEYSPPSSWTTHARSMGMEVRFGGRLTAFDDRTRYVAEVDVQPRGVAVLWAWLAVRTMRRQEPENLRRIKVALEG
ncbi:MAG TPA: SRPBCC family protein [Candidatus Limnocylindria bacterium]